MVDLSVEVIVFEILTWAPAKFVGRSKTVCKEWYAMLSRLDFIKLHTSRSLIAANQRMLLIDDSTCSVRPINLQSCDYGPRSILSNPFCAQFKDVSILSHFDGLLCVSLNDTHELLLWNPTTGVYKRLSNEYDGYYRDSYDAIGLYVDASDDYKVMHVKRRGLAWGAYIYSRRTETWRHVPVWPSSGFGSRYFEWSHGTLCGDTLYFTVCECWIGGKTAVVGFQVDIEQFKEIRYPPVPYIHLYDGKLVNVKNELHMILSTGLHEMSLTLWKLEDDRWINLFTNPPFAPIPIDLWCSITGYMTNGNWFLMAHLGKVYEVEMDMELFDCFYSINSFRGLKSSMFVETIVSPCLYF